MKKLLLGSLCAASLGLVAQSAQAEKFGFCEDSVKSGTECFLIMTQETYRKCRIVQSMMIIEYGFLESYLPDHNGEKLNLCIDKHRRGIQLPYQAALKEQSKHKAGREALGILYRAWLSNLEALIPAIVEIEDAYQQRVDAVTADLAEKVTQVRTVLSAPTRTAEKPGRSAAASHRKRQ